MLSTAGRKLRLEEGVAIEKAGDWPAAQEFWANSAKLDPGEIKFFIRQASAAIRIQEPKIAAAALGAARSLDTAGEHLEILEKLEENTQKLSISLFRIHGVRAFDSGEFETARENFEALDTAVLDHPWAAARARIAAGLAPSFAERLRTDLPNVQQRIFLTGCGRSGTWLLTAMLSCVPAIRAAERENPLGAFLDMPNESRAHLVKRSHDAYLHFDRVPLDIKILHMVRHPFDVLMSQHRDKVNYITLARLEAEHAAFFAHLEARKNTLVLKYEDLVQMPDAVQGRVEAFLGEKATRPFREFYLEVNLGADVVSAMHGLRPLDASSLYRWRDNIEAKTYLREQMDNSNGTLRRFSEAFDYYIDI